MARSTTRSTTYSTGFAFRVPLVLFVDATVWQMTAARAQVVNGINYEIRAVYGRSPNCARDTISPAETLGVGVRDFHTLVRNFHTCRATASRARRTAMWSSECTCRRRMVYRRTASTLSVTFRWSRNDAWIANRRNHFAGELIEWRASHRLY